MVRKPFLVAATILAGTAFIIAQDHGSHATSSASPSHNSSSWSHGGSFGGHGRGSGVAAGNPANSNPSHHVRPRSGQVYGYYPYGAPYQLPSDSEYDQMEGRGTLDAAQTPEPDNRVGPTIFEHNGRVSPSAAVSRATPPPSRVAQEEASESSTQAGTPTVLVFRDGHQQEIDNYAITPSKLIVLGITPQQIALSELDLPATAKANQDRGIEFKMPRPS